MDYDSSSKFISSLAKFLQSLCNGYVEFDNGVQVIGHLYLSVDTGKTIDYVLNEKVCKTDENSVTFISNSFHAQPAEKPKIEDASVRKETAQSENEQLEPKSTNMGTIPNSRGSSEKANIGKRPHSPSGQNSPSQIKKSRGDSSFEGGSQQNSSSVLNPQEPFTDNSFSSTFFPPEEEENSDGGSDRDIKPSLDTDVTFIKEEYSAGGDPPQGQGTRPENPSMFQSMFPQNQSYSGSFQNQNNYQPQNSQRPMADRASAMFPPSQMGSQLDPGESPVDPSVRQTKQSTSNSPQQTKDKKGSFPRIQLLAQDLVKTPPKWKERSRNFTCGLCYKSFVVKRDLEGHVNSVHLKVKPFHCQFCDWRSSHKGELQKHVKKCAMVYGDMKPQSTIKSEDLDGSDDEVVFGSDKTINIKNVKDEPEDLSNYLQEQDYNLEPEQINGNDTETAI